MGGDRKYFGWGGQVLMGGGQAAPLWGMAPPHVGHPYTLYKTAPQYPNLTGGHLLRPYSTLSFSLFLSAYSFFRPLFKIDNYKNFISESNWHKSKQYLDFLFFSFSYLYWMWWNLVETILADRSSLTSWESVISIQYEFQDIRVVLVWFYLVREP